MPARRVWRESVSLLNKSNGIHGFNGAAQACVFWYVSWFTWSFNFAYCSGSLVLSKQKQIVFTCFCKWLRRLRVTILGRQPSLSSSSEWRMAPAWKQSDAMLTSLANPSHLETPSSGSDKRCNGNAPWDSWKKSEEWKVRTMRNASHFIQRSTWTAKRQCWNLLHASNLIHKWTKCWYKPLRSCFFWCMHHMITWLEMAQLHRVNSPNMSCWIALKKFIGSFVHSFLSHPTGPTKSVTCRSSASFSPKDAQKWGLLDPSTWKQIQKEIGNHRAIFGWSWLLPTQLNFGGSSKLPRLGGHEKCSMRHTLSILEPRLPRCRPFFHVVLLHYANFSACFFRQF